MVSFFCPRLYEPKQGKRENVLMVELNKGSQPFFVLFLYQAEKTLGLPKDNLYLQ